MPIISDSGYAAPAFLANGHVQTLYPYLFRKVKNVQFETVRINTSDNDFIDLDHTDVGSDHVVILTHGLEGSSNAGYMKGMTKYLSERGYDVIAWNMRSCSGELNLASHFYHACCTEDVEDVVQFALSLKNGKKKKYSKVSFIAFSLGGNLIAYYLGEKGKKIHSEVTSATIFSTPFGLSDTIDHLSKFGMNQVYVENFLWTMRRKILAKHKLGKLDLCVKDIHKINSFREFDNRFTARLHGFQSAQEYYDHASACKMIPKITVPTLLVSAANDPIIANHCYPIKEANKSKNVYLEIPDSGGHVGFMKFNRGWEYWLEERAFTWLEEVAGEYSNSNKKNKVA